jgi:polysaccharide pyruvyl transferase WcaK-like protein
MSLKKILLVGNGPYLNRGCEAIVRGTMEIIRKEFGSGFDVDAFSYLKPSYVQSQQEAESDTAIKNYSLWNKRWSRDWWELQMVRRFGISKDCPSARLRNSLKNADAALLVGGDNYTFDYGFPYNHIEVNNFIQKAGVPLVLWGASVGPFDSLPDLKPVILDHLK